MLLAAVRDLVWPATCPCAPREMLAGRPRYGLCDVCVGVLTPNDGPRCAVCDAPGRTCCAKTDVRLRAPFLYGGPLADGIAAMKFRGREDLASGLGRLLADHVELEGSAIVPIPLATWRRFQRGFNQSAALAREVGRVHEMPVVHGLQRVRHTTPQHQLNAEARRVSLRGAFKATRRFSGRVILVDDVITTGGTMYAAADALLAAGATEVLGIALARTEG
jgi:competence protein ComFC